MLELATPDLYRANVFRVLGLHVDVSSGELAKRQKKMKMLEKLGADYRVRSAIFPLDPPPSEDDIRKAGQRLRDPESRLVHEVLWFWPAEYGKNSDGDSEIDLLRHNDLTQRPSPMDSSPGAGREVSVGRCSQSGGSPSCHRARHGAYFRGGGAS